VVRPRRPGGESGKGSVYRSLILADTGVSLVSEMGCAEVLSAGAVGWSLSHTDAWRAGWAWLARRGVVCRGRLWRRCFGVAVVFRRVLLTGRCATVVLKLRGGSRCRYQQVCRFS
jgi:hypothetical protein